MGKDYEVILLDIGGVLVEIKRDSKILEWANGMSDSDALWKRWFATPAMDAYHKGKISTDDFAHSMISEFKMPVSKECFLEEYAGYPEGLFAGVEEVLEDLAKRYMVVTFSNNNEIHWDRICAGNKFSSLFHRHFLSHDIGMVKPDKEAYLYVIKELGLSPEKILFFDDNEQNIDVAKEVGMQAIRVKGFVELKSKLEELGLIDA